MKNLIQSFLIVTLALAYSAERVDARTWQAGLEGSVERSDQIMQYRYYLPAGYDATQQYPLVLFLHGSGESGTDNTRQVSSHIRTLIEKTESEFPAVLVAPQLPESRGWSVGNLQDLTIDVLSEVLTDYAIDQDRLYITGLSMGGFGTMNYLHIANGINPDVLQFAAAAPIAGSFVEDSLAPILSQTPIWIAHGDADSAVDVSLSRETFNVLTSADRNASIEFPAGSQGAGGPMATSGNIRYTEYPRIGHNSWSRFYGSQDYYEWMFAQSLGTPVPEPSTLALLPIAMLAAFSRSTRFHRNSQS